MKFLLIILFFLCGCTWDYDWFDTDDSSLKLFTINNSSLRAGIHSIKINNTIYQIAYNDTNLYFNHSGSLTDFNKLTLGSGSIAPPITSPNSISTYYGSDNSLQILFINTSKDIYSCSRFDTATPACTVNPQFAGLATLPNVITGNNGYQYVMLPNKPDSVYLSTANNTYATINNPDSSSGLSLTSFTNLATDINGNLYALVTYSDSKSITNTYLQSYSPILKSWHKLTTTTNVISSNQKFIANSRGEIFFIIQPSRNSCVSNNKEKLTIGYIANGATSTKTATIDKKCTTPYDINEITVDDRDNIYLTLTDGSVFYGKLK